MSSNKKINKIIKKLRNEIEKISKSLKIFEQNICFENFRLLENRGIEIIDLIGDNLFTAIKDKEEEDLDES